MLESNNEELKIVFRSWASLASHYIGSKVQKRKKTCHKSNWHCSVTWIVVI